MGERAAEQNHKTKCGVAVVFKLLLVLLLSNIETREAYKDRFWGVVGWVGRGEGEWGEKLNE